MLKPKLSAAAYRNIVAECAAAWPNEACGVVMANGEMVKMRNAHEFPRHNFCFDSEEQLALYGLGVDVACVWHSHVMGVGEPSRVDIEMAELIPDTWQLIVALDAEKRLVEMRAWDKGREIEWALESANGASE